MASWFKRGKIYYLRFLDEKNVWKNKSMGRGVLKDNEADVIVARQNLIEANQKIGEGETKRVVPSKITEELKRYIQIDLLEKGFDGSNLAKATIIRYQQSLNAFMFFVKENNYIKFEDVGPREINSFLTKMSSSHSNSSMVQFRTALLKFFRWALSHDFINKNPVDESMKIKLKADNDLPFYYTMEQVDKVLSNCNDLYRKVFSFLYLTGVRIGELCNCEYSFIRQMENVQPDSYRYILQLPKHTDGFKTKRGRIVWLTEEAMEIINEQKKLAVKANSLDSRKYIFWNKNGDKLESRIVRGYLERVLSECGIDIPRAIHAWRHTYASHLVMRGVSLQTVMKLLGHTNIKQTMRYATLAPDFIQNAVDKNIYLPRTEPSVNVRVFKAKGAA